MFKKIFIVLSAVSAGMLALTGLYYGFEKYREKRIGGKLMRVHYRFTQEFED